MLQVIPRAWCRVGAEEVNVPDMQTSNSVQSISPRARPFISRSIDSNVTEDSL